MMLWIFLICSMVPCISFADSGATIGPAATDPEVVKEQIESILEREEFEQDDSGKFFVDLDGFFEKLAAPFRALGKMMESLSTATSVLIIIILSTVLLLFLAHIAYSLYIVMKRKKDLVFIPSKRAKDPQVFVEESKQLALSGNWVDASRKLYLAALTMLENRRKGRIRNELTNSEYLGTFKTDWVIGNLRVFGELIDRKWYRDHSFDQADYQHCKNAFESLETKLGEDTTC